MLAALWLAPAQAARTFTATQTSPAFGSAVDMGSAQAVTFSVLNTSGGGNAGERIYEMRFRLPGTGTVFASSTAAPAGWTRTAFSTTSVTFRASSWANSIPSGSALGFTLNMVMRTTTADVTESLRDARASYTLDTNFTNGITRSGRYTPSNTSSWASWALKSLQIVSFQTTDTLGNPITAIGSNTQFRVVLTVKNISSTTQSNIVSNPATPAVTVLTGAVSASVVPPTVYSPSPLTLAAGATGTITYTYNTTVPSSGTIRFSVTNVRNGANNATSRSAVSNILAVSSFVVNINVSKTCLYVSNTVTVTMDYINNSGAAINNIAASLAPSTGGIVTLVSGPTYAFTSVGAGSTVANAVSWNYQITGGTTGQTFTFNGSATGNSGTITTPTAISAVITRAGFDPVVTPSNTNASSTNAQINWGITNNGCAPVKSISITLPAGFAWNGDAYSLVNGADESWTVSGGNPATFTAPAVVNYLPLTFDADYSLVLSTPAAPGTYAFDLGVTDSSDVFSTRPVTLTVDPFNTGSPSLNRTAPGPWREQYQ
ncbi:hypothetical protein SCL_0383 [Sulfuricaulis limicola]|uniref:Uncharacterized protein n=1 Tax=Sulfuricaulis limicola TaxID=1620215 RepID=A0A1B4XD44_9GAMM|nr:hypothetical protein [Sulfuricaulis limicola]BAV32705.1 hypothetical protein SCL_0383 [Sulfuricaulis limicola]